MVWAAPALAAATLCLRVCTEPVKAAAVALMVGAVLSNAEHPDLPSSLLLEFPCIPTGDPPAADILALARSLQSEPGELSSAQLSCLARLLAAKNLTADFGSFPPDLLLFFPPSEVRAATCREFYARASRGNLDLLPSSRRTRLLRGAMSCLGLRGSRLGPQHLGSLGALVCAMEPGTIPASDPAVLENLKLCPALTGAQQDALNALLLTGDTEYGDPSSWDLQTLRDLGPLVLALNQTTLGLVAEAAREDFRRSIAASYSSQGHLQREKSRILLRALAAASAASHPRLKRSADRCQSKPITASSIADSSFFEYTLEQFDLCLSNEVLMENLEALLEQPINSQHFQILKAKVDRLFPSGIPEEQLRRLGELSRLYSEQEISRWAVTSSDTLSALLSPSGGEWEDSQVQQLLSRYLALGGSLTGPLLQEIGGKRLCNLQEEQIRQIPAGAVGTAGQLDISACSQTKKEELYRKAREAFASLASTPGPYYCRIRPYLGGAPAEDLKVLANAGVAINMDLDTFLALNPEELQKLSVTDVKNLLGASLPELKEAENEPLVVSWVQSQSQRELDCVLDIGLQGGLQEPTGTATPARPASSASVTSTATDPTPVSTTLPTVPSTLASVTSMATVPTSPRPTTPASVTPVPTTLPTVPTSPQPNTSASVTSIVTSLPTVPTSPHRSTSASATSVSTTVPSSSASVTSSVTVPTPTAITSHSTTQWSTVPLRTLTPSTLSPTPSDNTPPHTGGPPVPTATPSTRPALTTAVPCSTHQASTTNKATSPAVTFLSTLLATSSPSVTSPSSVPVTAVTSRATTSASVGTNPAGATHSTATPVPNPSSAPTATPVPNPSSTPTAIHSTITPVPHSSSASTAIPVPNLTSAPTATHSTATPVPNPSSAPPATSVPNPSSTPTATSVPRPSSTPTATSVPRPSSAPTATSVPHSTSAPPATHSTVTPVPHSSSAPTATPVPNPSSAPTAIPFPPSSSAPTATPVPNPTSLPTANPVPYSISTPTHNTVTPVPHSSSAPTATPVPNPSSAPTATHSTATPVPNPSSAPTATPVPHSTSVPTATTATHMTPSPPKPTPIPNSTISTQKPLSSSTAKPTTPPCPTSSPPGFPSPSPTNSSRKTTKPTPGGVPESPRPTPDGYINLQPEAGSGSRLCSCLVPVLAATLGNVLLLGLL